MNNKKTALMAIATLVLGAVGSIAYQSHAQTIAGAVQPVVSTSQTDVVSKTNVIDTDKIDNENGGVDVPDATVSSGDGDVETNDDNKGGATVDKMNQKDQQEQGNETNDANEVED
jgi:hypothetical protein